MNRSLFDWIKEREANELGPLPAPPAAPASPNETTDSAPRLTPPAGAQPTPAQEEVELISFDDLLDGYLEKRRLRITGGDPTTWPPTIYTKPMEG